MTLRRPLLDLAFVMDCTLSMRGYISTAQKSIRAIVEEIKREEQADVQLALVEYRDHPPADPEFVTRTHDFTPNVTTMKAWLDACTTASGNDFAEAVEDGLYDAVNLSWRHDAVKVCVMVSDAPPHGLGKGGDRFPAGCPLGHDPVAIGGQMAAKHIILYVIGCEPNIDRWKDFFVGLAHKTGGQYVPLSDANSLAKPILGAVQEEISLHALRQKVSQEVTRRREMLPSDSDLDASMVAREVHADLVSSGVKTKHLQLNNSALPAATGTAKAISGGSNLDEVRREMAHSITNSSSSSHTTAPSNSYDVKEKELSYEQTARMVEFAIVAKRKK